LLVSCLLVPLIMAAGCTPVDTQADTSKAAPVEPTPKPIPAKDLIREAPGVDFSKLTEPQRETFFQVINSEASACGASHSLAVSLRDDDSCRDSMHVAQFIAGRIGAGAQPGDIKLDLDLVVGALREREVPIEGRPVYGNERAPVTMVVFADFQCPVCKLEAPELRAAVDSHRGQAKLVFKHFPLTHAHAFAEAAAHAAEAAHLQGKFWEMSDKLFEHQNALEPADLERYATEIGLDVAKWKADIASDAVKQAVSQDQADGIKLELQGTPTVYVNGRERVVQLWGGELEAWIDDALRR
jgi:predicted DsbA family dithiol-disulfide isomerase